MVRRPAGGGRVGADKSELLKIEFIDKNVDNTHRILVSDVVIQCGKQNTLAAIFALNKPFRSPTSTPMRWLFNISSLASFTGNRRSRVLFVVSCGAARYYTVWARSGHTEIAIS